MKWLSGYYIISIPLEKCTLFLNLCMRYGFVYYDFKICDGRAYFTCSSFRAGRLLSACEAYGIESKTESARGLFAVLYRYRMRAGLFVGFILAVAVITLSRGVLWSINVSGNERLSEADVIAELQKNGFSVSGKLRSFDIDEIENRVLISSDDISWIAINMSGTVANVEIRETLETKREEVSRKPANLVAKYDGEIVEVQAYTGFVCVKAGDTVRSGDLLVSGLYDSKIYPYRYTRASGKIFAKTMHTFCIEIPLEIEEKVYSEDTKQKKTLNFFGKSIKLFINYGKSDTSCDIMNYEYHLDPFGLGRLPVSISTVEERPYVIEKREIGENEACELAFSSLEEKISAELGSAQLLKKTISTEIKDGKYILNCTVWCIEDIAQISEFEIKREN